jgi:hypothetical protein
MNHFLFYISRTLRALGGLPALFSLFSLFGLLSLTPACSSESRSNKPTGTATMPATMSATITAAFIQMAKESPCHQTKNRLFLIDSTLVFWDRLGRCPDNAYEQTLFGNSPGAVLATSHDSIAGPRTTINNEQYRVLYETILANLDKPDLGLGVKHKVQAIPF